MIHSVVMETIQETVRFDNMHPEISLMVTHDDSEMDCEKQPFAREPTNQCVHVTSTDTMLYSGISEVHTDAVIDDNNDIISSVVVEIHRGQYDNQVECDDKQCDKLSVNQVECVPVAVRNIELSNDGCELHDDAYEGNVNEQEQSCNGAGYVYGIEQAHSNSNMDKNIIDNEVDKVKPDYSPDESNVSDEQQSVIPENYDVNINNYDLPTENAQTGNMSAASFSKRAGYKEEIEICVDNSKDMFSAHEKELKMSRGIQDADIANVKVLTTDDDIAINPAPGHIEYVYFKSDYDRKEAEAISDFHCFLCPKRVRTAKNLQEHMLTHPGLNLSFCGECGMCFSSKIPLKKHVLTHSKSKHHICETCGAAFTEECHFTRHIQMHKGEVLKKHPCSLCEKSFNSPACLRQHMLTHIGEKTRLCSVCGKLFATADALRKHRVVHTAIRSFSCPTCEMSFKRSGHLKKHISIHTEKSHRCTVCGKGFVLDSYLRQHMVTHADVKPHPCEVCGKSFTRRRYLTAHMRIHTGEQPFRCNICGKSFSQVTGLNVHNCTHTGAKPHACTICNYNCTRADLLKQHMLKHNCTHTGAKPHACTICNYKSTRADLLKQHMLKHHTLK